MAFEDGKKLKIFTGNANPALAKEICDYLGLPLGEAFVGRFNNGEVQIMIDESVRGKDNTRSSNFRTDCTVRLAVVSRLQLS